MPLINIVLALVVAGMALYLIDHPYGLQHQGDLECSCGGGGIGMGIAGDGAVVSDQQLPLDPVT